MSDSEEDCNLPSQQECLERCSKFAELTGTDKALAMFYLQDRAWDLQRSVNAYFEDTGMDSTPPDSNPTQTTNSMSATSPTVKDSEPHRIRLLSWNIDGLDQQNLESRTKAVCELIIKENPHIVFLQEVVLQTEAILESSLKDYKFLSGYKQGGCEYFTIILLKKDFVTNFEKFEVLPYPHTQMGRNLLEVKVSIKNMKFRFMTTHLESCKEHSETRMEQLKLGFKYLRESENDTTVIFGGDLNLRDPELVKINGIPENVYDLWEMNGKRPEAKFTWDMARNDNNEMGGNFKPKCRFDRLYYKHSTPKSLKPVYFELIGLERLKSCQRFASDHWGMLVHFDKV